MLESWAEEIIVCNVASSYSTDVKEVYSTGKCVKLFCDTIERFLDEEKLTISRRNTQGQGRTENNTTVRHNITVLQTIVTSPVYYNILKKYY